MTHFELFNIPVSLHPDVSLLKQKFYELSRTYHPDFYTQATEDEQAEVLETSSQVNKAFKILQSPDETIKYVLQLNNLIEEEEKYQLPPDFLMEMMELNEQLMDAKMDDDPASIEKIKSAIADLQNQIYEPVKHIVEDYKEDNSTTEKLLQVKEYYFKRKYLNRILAGIN